MVFKGNKISFEKGRRINGGGNGDVFHIIGDKKEGHNLVAKFLKVYNGNGFEKKYKRFINEIQTVLCLSKDIDGLLPIIDYYTPEVLSGRERPWYVMPYADCFCDIVMRNEINTIEKIGYLREVAVLLSQLHKRGYAHRDIKPENIFILNENIKLGDFGLVWHEEYDGLTGTREKVGPKSTIAPEMKRNASAIKNPLPADVYSFAKTMWIVLTGDSDCFDGQYEKNKPFFLNSEELGVNTLEDIHVLIESATNDLPGERPSIDECIYMIDNWYESNSDKRKYIIQNINALNKGIQEKYDAQKLIYRDFITIIEIIREIIKYYCIESLQIKQLIPLHCRNSQIPKCIELLDNKTVYLMKPIELIKENDEDNPSVDRYILKVGDILEEEIPIEEREKYTRINDMNRLSLLLGSKSVIGSQKIILNGETNIRFFEKTLLQAL